MPMVFQSHRKKRQQSNTISTVSGRVKTGSQWLMVAVTKCGYRASAMRSRRRVMGGLDAGASGGFFSLDHAIAQFGELPGRSGCGDSDSGTLRNVGMLDLPSPFSFVSPLPSGYLPMTSSLEHFLEGGGRQNLFAPLD
jgi:hypothetical protein